MKNKSPSIGIWALLLGGTGFVCGFFGPIALNPEANQGPLLGLFVTGPGGTLLGLALGTASRWLPLDTRVNWIVLLSTCAVGGLVTLFFCFPEPRVLGYVLEGPITRCSAPSEHLHEAIAYWNKRIEATTWTKPRTGWKEDTARMLQDDGVVLEIGTIRSAQLLQHRKPWNAGKLSVSSWDAPGDHSTYFARFNGSDCSRYVGDLGLMFVAIGPSSEGWPPTDLQHFLNLSLIDPLPGRYRSLLD